MPALRRDRANGRMGEGICVNCLLREELAAEGEASTEVFESVLAEANVPDKMEKLDLAMPTLAHSLQTPCGAYVNDLPFAPL